MSEQPTNVKIELASKEVADCEDGHMCIQPSDNKFAYKDHDGGEHIISTDTNLVTSVNGKVGDVVLDTADIDATTDKNYVTDADLVTLGNTSGTNTGDQDLSSIESDIDNIEAKTDFITVTQDVNLDMMESDIATNSAKISNATHTGDATGSTALTVTGIQTVEIETPLPVDGLIQNSTLQGQWYQNLLLWSEDLSQSGWGKSSCSIDGTDGLISNTVDTGHAVSQSVNPEGVCTFLFDVKPEDKDYIFIAVYNATDGAKYSFQRISSQQQGSTSGDIEEIKRVDLEDGWYRFCVQITKTIISSYQLHPSESISDYVFAGDDSTVDVRFRNMQIYKGTIADNFPYIKTTTTTEPGTQKFKVQDAGATGTFTTTDAKTVTVTKGIIADIV